MPIQKIEKSFKFGILSTSYRVSLQEKLFRDFQEQQRQQLEATLAKESPCRVRSAFVRAFNQEQDELPKLKLKKQAYILLERIKRMAGILTNGEGTYVDTALAWRECVQLAQCEDRDIINASLDILWISLEQTPLSDALVPVCFDVAEILLYWISNRTSRQQAISSTELRTLQIGKLIFLRLYFYHMTCKINQEKHSEFRLRLAYQLSGFEDIVPIYQNYPDAWLCARVIDHVGKMITEGVSLANTEFSELSEVNSSDIKGMEKHGDSFVSQEEPVPVTQAITEGVHALSPSLWHALDVFRATESKFYSGEDDLQHALLGLVECDIMTKAENWLDCACAMFLLGDAAHKDISVLETVERLFISSHESRKLWHQSSTSKCGASSTGTHSQRSESLLQSLPAELLVCYAFLLVDVCLRSHDIFIQRYALIGDRQIPDPLLKSESCPTASLADLLVLQMQDPTNEWRIRYVTTLGLMLIRRCFANDSLRSGVSAAADVLLKSAPATGSSAYCRGQPAPVQQPGTADWFTAATLTSPWYYQTVLTGVSSNSFISLPCRLGRSLATHYLPARQLGMLVVSSKNVRAASANSESTLECSNNGRKKSAVEHCERTVILTKQSRIRSEKNKQANKNSEVQAIKQKIPAKREPVAPRTRPALSDEQLLRESFQVKAIDYEHRATNDLRNVVEDQWIKELHASLDAELLDTPKSPKPTKTQNKPKSLPADK